MTTGKILTVVSWRPDGRRLLTWTAPERWYSAPFAHDRSPVRTHYRV